MCAIGSKPWPNATSILEPDWAVVETSRWTSRCDVPARVERAERMLDSLRMIVHCAAERGPRTAQGAVLTNPAPDTFNQTQRRRGGIRKHHSLIPACWTTP